VFGKSISINEIRAVNKLCKSPHPNVVHVLQLGQLLPDSVLHYIDMELCSVSFRTYVLYMITREAVADLPRWENSPKRILHIYTQVVAGLVFIHENGEVHQELSPPNGLSLPVSVRILIAFRPLILLDGYWKITDFGFASGANSSQPLSSSSGKGKSYRAPELLDPRGSYKRKTDIWGSRHNRVRDDYRAKTLGRGLGSQRIRTNPYVTGSRTTRRIPFSTSETPQEGACLSSFCCTPPKPSKIDRLSHSH